MEDIDFQYIDCPICGTVRQHERNGNDWFCNMCNSRNQLIIEETTNYENVMMEIAIGGY